MKSLIISISIFVSVNASCQLSKFNFQKSTSKLSDSALLNLNSFYMENLNSIKPKIIITGYSDTLGLKKANESLAQKRVEEVASFLISKGYDSERIVRKNYGETTKFGEKSSENRCVTIELELSEGLFELLGLDQKNETFTIESNDETLIECMKGTLIKIPANAFVTANGMAVKKVELTVKEYYSTPDILLSNLTTQTSKGAFLTTGGMLYIEAKSGGEELVLKNGKELIISLPSAINQSGMKLFSGYNNGGSIIWDDKPIAQPDFHGVKYSNDFSFGERFFSAWYKKRQVQNEISAYLKGNIEYPEKALEKKACTKLSATYKVDPQGNIYNIKSRGKSPKLFDSILTKQLEEIGTVIPVYKKEALSRRVVFRVELIFTCDECKKGTKRYSLIGL